MKISTPAFNNTGLESHTNLFTDNTNKRSFMKNWIQKSMLACILLLAANLFFLNNVTGQATYTWAGANNASWATAGNWSPSRGTPAATDILQFNTGTTLNITAVPTQTIGRFVMSNNTNITLQSAGTVTLTIGNGTGTDLDIPSGSTLTIGGSNAITVTLNSSATAAIAGTLNVNSGRTYNTNGTTVVTTVTGTLNNAGTVTNTTASKLLFNGTGTYIHSQNGSGIVTATWASTSNCNITGVTTTVPTVATFGQTFGNLTWNCASQTADLSLVGELLNVAGNLTITATNSGSVRLSNSGVNETINIGGSLSQSNGEFYIGGTGGSNTWIVNVGANFSLTGGTFNTAGGGGATTINVEGNFTVSGGTLTETSTATNTVNFSGTGTQTYTSGSTITGNINFNVNSGATLQMAAAGTTVTGAGTFTVASGGTLGVTSTVGITTTGATGNIQSTGTRTYTAGANYIYNGSGAQVTGNGLTQNTPANLTLNNAAGLTLSAATTISGNLLISAGTLASNNLNLTVGGNWTNNGGFTPGTATVNLNGTGQAIGGSGALSFTNLTLSGSGNKTFAAAVTVSSVLSISGTAVALLANGSTSSANTLLLGGVGVGSGSWGGTISAATNTSASRFGSTTTGIINIAVSGCTAGNWIGVTSTDWFTASNWCSGVPTSSSDIVIPSGTPNQPNINAAGAVARNITINSGATLTITGSNGLGVSGNWTNNGTFTGTTSTVTFTGAAAQIMAGSAATLFGNLTINKTAAANTVTSNTTAFTVLVNLTVTQGDLILTATDNNYTVTGNLSVAANGTLAHNVDWDVAGKQLTVSGNIDINGAYTHSVARSHVQMTGTTKTLNTGTSSLSIVTLAGATVTANGPVTIADNFWAPFGTSGSFSTGGQTVIATGALLISAGTVNVNGGSLTVSGGVLLGSGTTNGILNVSSGTFVTDGITLGSTTSASASTITQSGGTFTVNGAVTINQPTANFTNAWNINAQTATVSGAISFAGTAVQTNRVENIVLTTGTLNANGGISFAGTIASTKVINLGTTGTLNLKGNLSGANVATLTAGTSGSIFNYNDNTTAQTVSIFGAGAYHNLHINTTGGVGATLGAAISAANVTGNLRVQTGTLNNGGFAIVGNAARTLEVANGAFLQLAGTTSAFPTAFGTVSLGATSTVDYRGSGAQTISAQNYGNLTTTVNGTRTITLANTGTIGIAGVFTPAVTNTSYTNTGSTVSFNGTTGGQNIPAFTFNNLVINNTADVTLTGNVNVNGTTNGLTFTNGKINTGANTITLAATTTVTTAGAGKYVNGKLAWNIPTGTPSRTYFVGDATNYTPATIAFTTTITATGIVTVSTTAGDHPNIATSALNASKSINRYWTVANTTVSPVGYTATFNFINPGDIDAGTNTANVVVQRWVNPTWNNTTIGTRTSTSTQITAVNAFGDFQIAELAPVCTLPTIDAPVITNISCNGANDGAIDITVNGGSAPFTYLWSTGAITEDISGLAPAATYTLTITATGGCSAVFGPFTVTEPAVLNASVGSTNLDCFDAGNGSISITSPTGGYGNYEYTINGGTNWQSSGSFTGLSAGTYDVRIRDADHPTCAFILNAGLTLTEPAVLNATVTPTDATCGNNDGSIIFTSPSGGSGAYEYTINGGTNWSPSGNFTGLAPGSYNVQIRDANVNSCVVIFDLALVINQASVPDAPSSGGNQTVCFNGDPEQTITASATSPNTITWFDAASGGNIVAPPSLTGIGTVTYYAEASNGGCVSTTRTAVTLTIQDAPVAPLSGGDETVCANGDPMQTLIATASSPVTITWFDASSGGNIVSPPALIGVGTVTYYAEASNGTCTSPDRTPVTLTINPILATPGTISGPLDVCPLVGSPTPSVYSIAPVAGATFYTWHVPVGTTIVSGQGTTSLSVTFDNSFALTNSFFSVTAEALDACTSGASSIEVLKIVPGIPLAINGPTNACEFIGTGANVVYSIDPVPNATSYTWVVSPNISLVSGQGTTSIEVNFLTGYTTGNVRVTANSNCGNRAPRVLSIAKTVPASPGNISGPIDACPFLGTLTPVVYSIDPVDNAISYTWTVPANVVLVSGQGSTSITVNFNSGYTTSLFKVKAVSNCFTTGDRTLSVAVATPNTPGSITGPTNACAFIGSPAEATYTIRKVTNATSYIWAVPAGASITSHPGGAGINDTIINVSYNNSFVSGTNISVQAAACGTSAPKTLSVTRILPTTPGLITGFTNACPYMVSGTNPSGTAVTYSIFKVANAGSYLWTVPSGASINSHPGGAGVNDTIITVIYGAGFTSGSVTVAAVNDCGTGSVRSLAITRLTAGTPGAITAQQITACPSRQYTYTLAVMPTNSTSILWSVPAQGTIQSGQGSTSITVTYTSAVVTGAVTATAYNNCSNSSTRTLNVSLPACGPRPIVTKTVTAPVPSPVSMQVTVSPNPSVSDFKLKVITAGKEEIRIRILDMQGRSFKNLTVAAYQTISIGADLKAGSYFVEVTQGNNKVTERLLKF